MLGSDADAIGTFKAKDRGMALMQLKSTTRLGGHTDIMMRSAHTTRSHPNRAAKEGAPARAKRAVSDQSTNVSSPVSRKHGEDAAYWQSRAERTKAQALKHRNPAVRDHLMEIAAGYEELARRAR
jgi:hypothetical protein